MRRIIVGISGASGIILGVRALQMLRDSGVETHLVISKSAELTAHHELEMSMDEVRSLADVVYPVKKCGCGDRQWLLPHRWHAHRALLDSHHVGDRHRCHRDAADPCG